MATIQNQTSASGWSQWVVIYPNGIEERCHNRATAETLARRFNSEVS